MAITDLKINLDVAAKFKYEPPAAALEKWNPAIKSAAKDDNVINIYDSIGQNWDGTGVTAKLVSSILRKADGADVVVNINSPGGDFFEGLAINTILSEYEGGVTVRVVGMAASAASIIAMAGDDIEIAEAGFFMIHNAWTVAIGNKSDMREVSDMLAKFDESMVGLYAKKTGIDEKAIRKMMDAETWIDGEEAVELKFATAVLGNKEISLDNQEQKGYAALRKVDTALAKAGMPRSERRSLIKELTGTPGAANEPTPCAGVKAEDVLKNILTTLKQYA